MKKILFAAVNLDVGGIETALVTLLNYLAEEKENNNYKYDITLVLEEKKGIFLDALNKKINIIEYTPNKNKIIFIRKIINFIKQLKFKLKYKNKFDFACSYATYSLPACFVAREASKNATLWCHMDYLAQFNENKDMVKDFFSNRQFKKFKRLVFVSEKSKQTFLEVYPEMKDKAYFINNLIDYEAIKEKSLENIKEEIDKKNNVIFINIGRHDEEQKRLTRLIEACKILKENKLKFKVLLVGDGKDTQMYKDMVSDYKLENIVLFLGRKSNPYPYLNISDCMILTSEYEGSPVVFTETMILNKPIITTGVAGSEQILNKYGFIAQKDAKDIAEKMQNFIEQGYKIKKSFEPEKYNADIIKKLTTII